MIIEWNRRVNKRAFCLCFYLISFHPIYKRLNNFTGALPQVTVLFRVSYKGLWNRLTLSRKDQQHNKIYDIHPRPRYHFVFFPLRKLPEYTDAFCWIMLQQQISAAQCRGRFVLSETRGCKRYSLIWAAHLCLNKCKSYSHILNNTNIWHQIICV